MKQYIQPLSNRVLLKKIKIEEKTSGGIILPMDETTHRNELSTIATVIDIGNKVDETLGLDLGQTVMYAKHSQTETSKEDFILVKEVDIQAIIHEGEDK